MSFLTIFSVLQADAEAATQVQGGGLNMILMLVAIFAVMYFFMIRPQQKKQKELQKFRNELKKGDKVVTLGGIYGTVEEINADKVMMRIDTNTKIRVARNSLVKDFSEN